LRTSIAEIVGSNRLRCENVKFWHQKFVQNWRNSGPASIDVTTTFAITYRIGAEQPFEIDRACAAVWACL
jgi:hypothetical protein